MSVKDEKDTMRFRIIELLEADERARNDDKWLIWRYLHDVLGIKIYIPFEEFKNMPSFDSIRRIRQQVQNTEQKFLPTDPKVRIQRRIDEENWRIWCRRAKEIYGFQV